MNWLKVLLLAEGLDDRAVEISKLVFRTTFCKLQGQNLSGTIFFAGVSEAEVPMVRFEITENEQTYEFTVTYQKLLALLRLIEEDLQPAPARRWLQVDAAHAIIEGSGEGTPEAFRSVLRFLVANADAMACYVAQATPDEGLPWWISAARFEFAVYLLSLLPLAMLRHRQQEQTRRDLILYLSSEILRLFASVVQLQDMNGIVIARLAAYGEIAARLVDNNGDSTSLVQALATNLKHSVSCGQARINPLPAEQSDSLPAGNQLNASEVFVRLGRAELLLSKAFDDAMERLLSTSSDLRSLSESQADSLIRG